MTTFLTIFLCVILGLFSLCAMYLVYERKELRQQLKEFSDKEVQKNELKETLNTGNKIDNVLNSLDLLNNHLDKLPDDKE